MLKYALEKATENTAVYALTEEGEKLGEAETEGCLIRRVTFISEAAERKYRDFMLRSAAFVLSNHYPEVKTAFCDDLLTLLGFTKENGGMTAKSIDIRFDGCACEAKESRQ